MSTSVLASVCPDGSVGVCVQRRPSREPQTAAELSAALLSIQKLPALSIASRGSEKPFEFGRRTVWKAGPPAPPTDGAATNSASASPSGATRRKAIQGA